MYYDADLKDWYKLKRINKLVNTHLEYDFLDALDIARVEYELELKEHVLKLNETRWNRSLKKSG